MDGLKRQQRKQAEKRQMEKEQANTEVEEDQPVSIPKQRVSFLDKITERVKEFLDNAE
jgi:cell division protein FtsA